MNFDLTPAFTSMSGPAESQRGEGGANAFNNCLPDALADALVALGYPEWEPQAITDDIYGVGHVGYTYFDDMIAWVKRRVDPNLLVTSEGGDIITLMDRFGPQGFPMLFVGHSDGNAVYQTYDAGVLHVSNILRRTDNWTVLLNSEWGTEVGFNDSDMAKVWAGSMLVLHKPVKTVPVNPSPQPTVTSGDDMALTFDQKRGIVFDFRMHFEDWPSGQDAVDAYAKQIHDNGDNIEAVYGELRADFTKGGQKLLSQRVAALEAKLAAMGNK